MIETFTSCLYEVRNVELGGFPLDPWKSLVLPGRQGVDERRIVEVGGDSGVVIGGVDVLGIRYPLGVFVDGYFGIGVP